MFGLFLAMIILSALSFAVKGYRREYSAVLAGIFLLAVVVYSIMHFRSGYGGGYVSVTSFTISQSIGIYYSIGVSGFTDGLLIVSAIVVLAAILVVEKGRYTETIYSYIMLVEVGLFGIFISTDFLFFYIFWEVVLIPIYFMIAQYGGSNRDRVSLKFFVYTHIGSVFLLLSIFSLYAFHTFAPTFQIQPLMSPSYFTKDVPPFWQVFVIFGFAFSFLVKMPSFPIHSWLPDSYDTAPYPGTILLAGGLSLMGGYGLFGILIQIAPVLSSGFLWLLISLGIASMVYFSLSAMMQRSLKRMMAYASAGAMGFVTLSFGAGLLSTSYNRTLELSGGMFQVIAHGLIMSLVFAALYFIRINTGRESIPTLGGIFREAPVVSTFLLAGLMASLGLPGMAGFIGEFSVLIGSFQIIGWLILIVIFAMIITASYHIWAAQRSLYGPYNETIGPIKDVGVSQLAVLSWLLVTIIILGVLPNLFFGILTPYVGGI